MRRQTNQPIDKLTIYLRVASLRAKRSRKTKTMYNFIRPQTNQEPLSVEVLVFKTDLDTPERISGIKGLLDTTHGICKWNVDIHDCDNVLRVETLGVSPRRIESVLREAGYYCMELPD